MQPNPTVIGQKCYESIMQMSCKSIFSCDEAHDFKSRIRMTSQQAPPSLPKNGINLGKQVLFLEGNFGIEDFARVIQMQ